MLPPKGTYLPLSKLHSILEERVNSFSDNLTPLVLPAMVHYVHLILNILVIP